MSQNKANWLHEVFGGYAAFAAIAAILVLASFLRLMAIGEPSFTGDELWHILTAQSVLDGQGLVLPSGVEYRRAFAFTYLVTFFADVFGMSETSTRIPSAIFGVLSVFAVFLIGRRWFSVGAGLIAALIMAMAPFDIAFSRQVRFYSLYQLAFLGFLYFSYAGLERYGRHSRAPSESYAFAQRYEVHIGSLIIATLLFLLAFHLQSTAVPSLSGPTAYLMVLAVGSSLAAPINRNARIKYFTILSAGLVICVAVALTPFGQNFIAHVTAQNSAMPVWAEGSWRYYRDLFVTEYPIVFGTLPFMALFALRRNTRAALFVMLCFAVPVAVHSLLIDWKQARYILHVVPLLYILFGAGAAGLIHFLYRSLSRFLNECNWQFNSKITAVCLVSAAGIITLSSTPWLITGLSLYDNHHEANGFTDPNDWRRAVAYVQSNGRPGDTVVASLPALVYYYAPEFNRLFALNGTLDPEGTKIVSRDKSVGAIDVHSPDSLTEVLVESGCVWLLIESNRFANSQGLSEETKNIIRSRLSQVSIPELSDMEVWRMSQCLVSDGA